MQMASSETTTQTDRWFGQSALAEAAADTDRSHSEAQRLASAGSVRALIADLRYIMSKEQPSRWPVLASAALQHHSPPVPDDQLSADYRELQTQGRRALTGVCQGSFEEIRNAVIEIRAVESRLQPPD